MAGNHTIAFEDEQVLVFSPDVYCIYSCVTITFSKERAIVFRLFRFTDKQLVVRKLVVRKQASG